MDTAEATLVLRRACPTIFRFIGLIAVLCGPSVASAASPFLNFEDLVRELNIRQYYSVTRDVKPIRIAVLDNGFFGYEKALGKTLPAGTIFHKGAVSNGPKQDRHGLVMAELLNALMTDAGNAPQFTPELHLYESYGFDGFRLAVEDAIASKVDLILYSQVWEYGGNPDGSGFINPIVTRALRAGITWVNASGDFGTTTFHAPIRTVEEDWVELPDANHGLMLRCEGQDNPDGKCPLRLVLSWNDFKNDSEKGTAKDLDLALTDDMLNIVATSGLVQVEKTDGRAGQSLYPREIISTELKTGTYFVRVKNRSHNFGPKDRLRITAGGDFITMPRHSAEESLLAPADLNGVITVGASDADKNSFSKSIGKPDIQVQSLIRLSAQEQYIGSSSAAAVAAAGLGVLKSTQPKWDRDTLVSNFQVIFQQTQSSGTHGGQGIPQPILGFSPAGNQGCFIPLNPQALPQSIELMQVMAKGGTPVMTSGGPKILFDFDPIALAPGVERMEASDLLALGPDWIRSYPRAVATNLPPGMFEVAQVPKGQRICGR